MNYRYRITKLPRTLIAEEGKEKSRKSGSVKTAEFVAIYNQFTGQVFYADISGYLLQDGDIIQTDPTYYEGGANAPDPAANIPIPDFSFAVDAEPVVGGPAVQDVIVYNPNPEPVPVPGTPPENNNCNYPADDTTTPPTNPDADPGCVEIDLSFFDSFEQYYDENDEPVYTGSECDTSIGIRG